MSENEVILTLDNMNAKQKAKEYKATAKSLNSKDLEIKLNGLQKLADMRYFTEGNCFKPFIDSLAPNKVSICPIILLFSFSLLRQGHVHPCMILYIFIIVQLATFRKHMITFKRLSIGLAMFLWKRLAFPPSQS